MKEQEATRIQQAYTILHFLILPVLEFPPLLFFFLLRLIRLFSFLVFFIQLYLFFVIPFFRFFFLTHFRMSFFVSCPFFSALLLISCSCLSLQQFFSFLLFSFLLFSSSFAPSAFFLASYFPLVFFQLLQ